MDAKEFKAWFEGFCEGVGEAPTAEQWAKLKQKVSALAEPFYKPGLPSVYRDSKPSCEGPRTPMPAGNWGGEF